MISIEVEVKESSVYKVTLQVEEQSLTTTELIELLASLQKEEDLPLLLQSSEKVEQLKFDLKLDSIKIVK